MLKSYSSIKGCQFSAGHFSLECAIGYKQSGGFPGKRQLNFIQLAALPHPITGRQPYGTH
jgi:hypothetical protein